MGINDYGGTGDALNSPPLGGPGGWAEAVAAVVDGDDTTVDARIAAHSADSTNVHGIPDTANLTTTAELEAYAAALATVGNRLTDNQAAFQSVGAWELVSATESAPGVYTATSSGAAGSYTVQSGLVAGTTYTLSVTTSPVGRTGRVAVQFRDSSNVNIGGANLGNLIENGSTGVSSFIGVAPVGTASAILYTNYTLGAIGDVITISKATFHAGAGGNWAMPGTPITGLGTRITRPNTDDRLVEQWNVSAWSVVDYDSGWRNIAALLDAEALAAFPTIGAARVRRINNTVFLEFRGSTAEGSLVGTADGTKFWTWPAGFKRDEFAHFGVGQHAYLKLFGVSNEASLSYCNISPLSDGSTWGGASVSMAVPYVTSDPIPASLPGTLISPAPQ